MVRTKEEERESEGKVGGGDGGRECEKQHGKVDEEGRDEGAVPLVALNHVSRLCRSIESSVHFYEAVLGFVCTNRPQIFDADGAWLFNYGVGIHLLQSNEEDVLPDPDRLDPVDNHISFQQPVRHKQLMGVVLESETVDYSTTMVYESKAVEKLINFNALPAICFPRVCADMDAMEKNMKDMNVKHIRKAFSDKESGTKIDQLFFNDPDGYMIEICNCENLQLEPKGSFGRIRLPTDRHTPPLATEPPPES